MDYAKTFFIQIHRSITDPLFYKEVAAYSKRRVLSFVISLLVITAIVMSIFHYHRIADPDFGLPKFLPIALSNVTISSNELINTRNEKYVIDPVTLNEILNLLSDVRSNESISLADSIVMVDGINDVDIDSESSILLYLNKSNMLLNYGNGATKEIPYSLFIKDGDVAQFTKESVSQYLSKNLIGVFMNMFFVHFIKTSFNILSSVVFLAIAAFIFKRNAVGSFGVIFKMSLYASAVLAIENLVTSAAGYSSWQTWYAAVFISIFALFRGLNAIANDKSEKKDKISGIM